MYVTCTAAASVATVPATSVVSIHIHSSVSDDKLPQYPGGLFVLVYHLPLDVSSMRAFLLHPAHRSAEIFDTASSAAPCRARSDQILTAAMPNGPSRQAYKRVCMCAAGGCSSIVACASWMVCRRGRPRVVCFWCRLLVLSISKRRVEQRGCRGRVRKHSPDGNFVDQCRSPA